MKICTKCKIPQKLTEFRKDRSRKDNLHPMCNTCNNKHQRSWYNKNKDKARSQARDSYDKRKEQINEKRRLDRKLNPEKHRTKAKDYYKKNPLLHKVQSWKQAGIKNMTMERYMLLLEKQMYCCAVCGTPQHELSRKLDVDHNHDTGEVRGLLCLNCNQALGRLKESPEIITNLLNYVKYYK